MKRFLHIFVCLCISLQVLAQPKEPLLLTWGTTEVPDSLKKTNPERLAYPTALEDEVPVIYCDGDLEEIGLFSVSATRKVAFSPGNLQYTTLGTHVCADGTTQPGTWRFAHNQWEFVGEDNSNISVTYTGWIDLFGWGTSGWSGSGTTQYQPWSQSRYWKDWETPNSSMSGDYKYCDWGQYNAINNVWHTDSAGTWYTLSNAEWKYLFVERPNAIQLYGRGMIAGIAGMILLPDEWQLPDGLSFQSGGTTAYIDNTYTIRQWRAMEANGAVFLPEENHSRKNILGGCYHSSNCGSGWSGHIYFSETRLGVPYNTDRYSGCSVRLVKIKERLVAFPVGGGRYVRFAPGNLQYSAEGTHLCADGTTQPGTWRFAEHQWDFVGDAENGNVFDSNGQKCNNNLRGENYTGWIDQFSWGTSGYNGKTPWLTSNNNADFVWGLVNGAAAHGDIDTTYYDWGAYNQIGDDPPGTWRTITKAQFDYITRSNSLQGLATVNGVEGHVLLPDEWILPEGLNWTGLPQDYDVNVYTLEEWERMEANGAVFFPKTKNFAPANPNIDIFGNYWTATGATGVNNTPVTTSAVDIFFSPYYYNINRNNSFRTSKCCVRLIQYVK
ncbi:MAG: hypothetical protein II825_07825 [Paludibacteraceae bacterium]|nr:hypothetical protein [Paludibacteraceae bacterium]